MTIDQAQPAPSPASPAAAEEQSRAIVDNVSRVIQGKAPVIRQSLAVMVAGGHVLLEDVPGVGKTELAGALAASVGCTSRRIQFTSDLLPGDITGVSVPNRASGEFEFHPGPIFANVVIADEINRTSPRTQSALLEAMAEGRVSIDGVTRRLATPFLVVATQNPFDMEGTYPLPEAQRDRFMARFALGYPDEEAEMRMLGRSEPDAGALSAVIGRAEFVALQEAAQRVRVVEAARRYIVAIARATRMREEIALGASPRATLQLAALARATALLSGRDYLVPDDVATVAPAVLAHRLLLADRGATTADAERLVADIIHGIAV